MERPFRSERDEIIGGVCGGLGPYLNVDPLVLRILFVVGAMLNGIGLIVYVLLWIFIPTEETGYDDQEEVISQNVAKMLERIRTLGRDAQQALGGTSARQDGGALLVGLAFIVLGVLVLMRNFGLLGWIRHLWPLVLIAIGALMLLDSIKGKD